MKTADLELRMCQSSQQATSLSEDDASRFDKNILKIEKFLSEFVEKNSPIDRPDSTYPNEVQA